MAISTKRKREANYASATGANAMKIKSKITSVKEYNPLELVASSVELEREGSAKKFKSDEKDDVLVLDRLHGTNGLSALKDIQTKINLSKSSTSDNDDPMDAFFQEGGTARDLLEPLNVADKIKNSDVNIVFNACEAILLYLGARTVPSQIEQGDNGEEKNSKLKKMQALSLDLTREILQNHLKYLMMFLSESNTVQQGISSLRLLAAMVVAGGPTAGKEVLLKVDFEHPNITSLSSQLSKKDNLYIRKCHLEFLVSFFVAGNSSVIKEFLDKPSTRNHLASLFPGFIYDECEVVQLVIGTLHEKVLDNLAISKTVKMKLFGVHNLKYILALLGWRGPKGKAESIKGKKRLKDESLRNDELEDDTILDEKDKQYQADLEAIRQITKDFFISALTSVKKGLVFFDSTCGTSGNNQNLLLQNILQSMTSYKPWKEKHMSLFLSEIVIKSLASCPDQLRPYFSKALQPLWTPKEESDTWRLVATFLTKIYIAQDPLYIVNNLQSDRIVNVSESTKDATSKLLANVLSNIFCNDKIYREVVNPSITSTSKALSTEGFKLLTVLMKKLEILLLSKVLPQPVKKQVIHRLSDKILPFKALADVWKQEIVSLSSCGSNTSGNFDDVDLQNLKMVARIFDFYWTHIPFYSTGSHDTVIRFLQDMNQFQERFHKAKELGSFSYIQLILLKRLASLSTTPTSANSSSATLASPENIKVLVNLATSSILLDDINIERSKDLALETISRIMKNARMLDCRSNKEHLFIWFNSVQYEDDITSRENIKAILADCLSKALKCKEILIQESNMLQKTDADNDGEREMSCPQDLIELDDECAFQTLMFDPDLMKCLNYVKKEKPSDTYQNSIDEVLIVQTDKKPSCIVLHPIEIAILKCTELQMASPTYVSRCLCTLISFQDDPKLLYNFILNEEKPLISNGIKKQLRSFINDIHSYRLKGENNIEDSFLLKQSIFQNLMKIKLSTSYQEDNTIFILDALKKVQSPTTKNQIITEILEQPSIVNLFDPYQFNNLAASKMILNMLKDISIQSTRSNYMKRFLILSKIYLKQAQFENMTLKDVAKVNDVHQESFLVLVDSSKQAETIFQELHECLPQVSKVIEKENTHLR